jgi:hypothetical protein
MECNVKMIQNIFGSFKVDKIKNYKIIHHNLFLSFFFSRLKYEAYALSMENSNNKNEPTFKILKLFMNRKD